jgi:transposase-like protein
MMESDTPEQPPAQRKHSATFKAQIPQACMQPGASLSGIAISHGLNRNMVQRWRREARRGDLALTGTPRFIPVETSARRGEAARDVSLQTPATIQVLSVVQ